MDDLISRQAAIDALHTWFRDGFDEDKWWNSTHVLAAIEGLPPAQPEPCEDAVSRKAVITQLSHNKSKGDEEWELAVANDIETVWKLPPVMPKQRTGKWIDVDVMGMPAQACDQCNTFFPLAYTGGGHHYCPNCGAKMEVTT